MLQRSLSVEPEKISDVVVSCDGTWQKSGFQSPNGVFAVLSVDSGKFLDVEAMSRTCKACCLKTQLKNTDPVNYAHWRNSHL